MPYVTTGGAAEYPPFTLTNPDLFDYEATLSPRARFYGTNESFIITKNLESPWINFIGTKPKRYNIKRDRHRGGFDNLPRFTMHMTREVVSF